MRKACTHFRYKQAVLAATPEGMDPREVMMGNLSYPHTCVRWKAWRRLVDLGCTYYSIARISGFDHTTIMHAYKKGEPERGRPRNVEVGAV